MYAAKRSGCGVQAYRAEDGHSTARRLALAADLKVALREGALELHYQPQADARTGQVVGFEALLRWRHPRLGYVPPPEIITVAHRTGLVRDLTDSILSQALHSRACWAAAGHDLDVSVNVTPADVADLVLVDRVDAALRATATPPGALVLEITESDAMRDPERSLAVLEALATRGVRLSIDDFGTGHSSLAYLDQLAVHEVKIDQSFVFRLDRDAADSTIVRATIALAHDLGLRVVAEGVESDLAKSLLSDMGCDRYQGTGWPGRCPAPRSSRGSPATKPTPPRRLWGTRRREQRSGCCGRRPLTESATRTALVHQGRRPRDVGRVAVGYPMIERTRTGQGARLRCSEAGAGPAPGRGRGPRHRLLRRPARLHEGLRRQPSEGVRVVQLTPEGSGCSVGFGTGLDVYAGAPGSVRGVHLVVEDITEARAELVRRGVEIGEIQDFGGGVGERTSPILTATPSSCRRWRGARARRTSSPLTPPLVPPSLVNPADPARSSSPVRPAGWVSGCRYG